MKIVACPGYQATLHIAKSSLTITQFEPVDLSGYTKTAIKHSNLQSLLNAKFVEEYTGQTLPKKTNEKVQIPTMEQVIEAKAGEKDTQVKFTQTKGSDDVNTQVTIPEGFSEQLTARSAANREAQEQALTQVVKDVGGNVNDISETNIKKLTEKDLKISTVVVDGKSVKNFKFPEVSRRDQDENSSKDDLK